VVTAVVYARFSSELQADRSIDDQVRLCRRFIEQQGWGYQYAYTDRAISGATALRPAYQALLEDARRGTGILNNELYIGKLVWNRQTFIKDPNTGKRQARPNPPEDWVVQEVPELRIIGDALWNEVKARQQHVRRALTHDNAGIRSERSEPVVSVRIVWRQAHRRAARR